MKYLLSVVLNPVDNELLATLVGAPQVLQVGSGWVALLHNVSRMLYQLVQMTTIHLPVVHNVSRMFNSLTVYSLEYILFNNFYSTFRISLQRHFRDCKSVRICVFQKGRIWIWICVFIKWFNPDPVQPSRFKIQKQSKSSKF